MFALYISILSMGCTSKTATLDTSLGEPTQEPTQEPSEQPAIEPSSDITDADGDGFSSDEGDCDDSDATRNPGAADIANDGIDQDCDGSDFQDGLCDDSCLFAGDSDCDDGGPYASSPLCDFGTDCSDCGPRIDNDEDGFFDDEGTYAYSDSVQALLDCDDSNPNINPDAVDTMNDGIDQDCNGEDLTELCTETCSGANNGLCEDGGSYSTSDTCDLGSDCADCGSRIDGDMDGFDEYADCDDGDATINPLAEDVCNGFDDDCDGDIDEDIDSTEPNSASSPYLIGNQEDFPLLASATIAYEGDQDGYTIYTYDGWTTSPDFSCTISAPPDLNLNVTLLDPLGATLDSGNTGLGGETTVALAGTWGDDTGTYLLIINSIDGYSCTSSYTINCIK